MGCAGSASNKYDESKVDASTVEVHVGGVRLNKRPGGVHQWLSRLALMRYSSCFFCGSCVVGTNLLKGLTYIFWVVVFATIFAGKLRLSSAFIVTIVTFLSLSLIMSTVRQPPIHQESGEWRLSMGHVDVSLNLRTHES